MQTQDVLLERSQIPADLMDFFEPAGCGKCYVCEMVAVFREVRRVLREDGTLWLNLGDSYAASPPGNVRGVSDRSGLHGVNGASGQYRETLMAGHATKRDTSRLPGIKPKDLIGIPWRVAFALQADGWYLRSDIIWHKPNPMPESVTDRPTRSHEYIFLLTKAARYYYDSDAIAEPVVAGFNGSVFTAGKTAAPRRDVGQGPRNDADTRNKRDVWTVATQPFSGVRLSHDEGDGNGRIVSPDCPLHGDQRNRASTAVYGEPQGASPSVRNPDKNGRPAPTRSGGHVATQTRLDVDYAPDSSDSPLPSYAPSAMPHSTQTSRTGRAPSILLHETDGDGLAHHTDGIEPLPDSAATSDRTHGSRNAPDASADEQQSCQSAQTISHNAHKCTCPDYTTKLDHFAVFPPKLIEPCILAGCPAGGAVLDPFMGSGTTGLVAIKHGRNFVGIELNKDYIKMAINRLSQPALPFVAAPASCDTTGIGKPDYLVRSLPLAFETLGTDGCDEQE